MPYVSVSEFLSLLLFLLLFRDGMVVCHTLKYERFMCIYIYECSKTWQITTNLSSDFNLQAQDDEDLERRIFARVSLSLFLVFIILC